VKKSQYAERGERTKDKMIAAAKEEAKVQAAKIISDAQLLSSSKDAALTDIKNQVGNLVIEVSEKFTQITKQ